MCNTFDLSAAGEVIEWNDTRDQWECRGPLAGLNCDVGDQLRMGGSGWECSAEPITASLIQNNWQWVTYEPVSAVFDSINNVNLDSPCAFSHCEISNRDR